MNINGKELSPQEYEALRDMALVGVMNPNLKEYQFDYWNILYSRLFPEKLVIRKVSPDGIAEDEQEMRKKLTEILGDSETAKKIFDIVDKRDGKESWKVLFVRRIRNAHKQGRIDESAMRGLLLSDDDDELTYPEPQEIKFVWCCPVCDFPFDDFSEALDHSIKHRDELSGDGGICSVCGEAIAEALNTLEETMPSKDRWEQEVMGIPIIENEKIPEGNILFNNRYDPAKSVVLKNIKKPDYKRKK